jgi:hypothetical protein
MKLLLTILTTFLIFTAEAQLRQCQINVRNEIKKTCIRYGLNNNQINILCSLALRESSFDPDTFNRKDKSVGIFAITPIFVDEVNRILGFRKYSYIDRFSLCLSIEMMIIHTNRHVPNWNHKKICQHQNRDKNYYNLIQKEINIARN